MNPALPSKTRLIVSTDISSLKAGVGEPDDTQSLVRLLLHANEFDIEGLIATSTKRGGEAHPEYIRSIVRQYGKVRANLALHDPSYPTEHYLLNRVKAGLPDTDSIGKGRDSEGSNWIISVVDRADPRPVWIVIWGGSRELAQALWKVKNTRTADEFAAFQSKIRVYAITDQDKTGRWIRAVHPNLFYITSRQAFRGMYRSGDPALVGREWVDKHVTHDHGPLGAAYPNYDGGDPWGRVRGVKEGDTPSFLYLIPNGLGDPERPEWGSWGGRFAAEAADRAGSGKDAVCKNTRHYFDAKDTVNGETSERATVYRWRPAYQADFQARLDWCVRPPDKANHPPVAVLNGPGERVVRTGEKVVLSAEASHDPDGDRLSYCWFHHPEAGTYEGTIKINGANTPRAWFVAPEVDSRKTIHIILAVTDSGDPALTRYRRVVVTVERS
jgi:hypothetical protein